MNKLFLIILLIMLVMSMIGCRCMIYIAVGHQSIEEMTLQLKGQVADPNVPAGLIKVGAISL